MVEKLIRWFAAFCIATVITQGILLTYFALRGSLGSDTLTKVIALANGIDITGERLQQILEGGQEMEQPDFSEILEARKLAALDMDMRLRSQDTFRDEISTMLAELQTEKDRFDQRREWFDQQLEEIRLGAQEAGVQEVQRTIQALPAEQAKDQLLRIYDDERIDEVVNIIQAIPMDKRKDILGEFVTPDEADKLHEILRRIGDGIPTTTLIDQAQGGP